MIIDTSEMSKEEHASWEGMHEGIERGMVDMLNGLYEAKKTWEVRLGNNLITFRKYNKDGSLDVHPLPPNLAIAFMRENGFIK